MDGETVSLPNQQSSQQPMEPIMDTPQPPKKHNMLGVEVLIIIIFLSFTVGILNYFNILPLSKHLPNFLGFLPHRPYEQSKQYSNVKIPPTIAPTSSLAKQAKETLITFLPTILKHSLLPKSSSDINLREDKGIKQSVSGTWDTKDGKAITILSVSPNAKEISQLLIFFPYATTESISAESAQSTIPELFSVTPKGKWACKTIPNTADYCENFWEENGTRRGIALKRNIPFSQAKKISISFCEHSQKSILYSWKSCASEFAKTGVK